LLIVQLVHEKQQLQQGSGLSAWSSSQPFLIDPVSGLQKTALIAEWRHVRKILKNFNYSEYFVILSKARSFKAHPCSSA